VERPPERFDRIAQSWDTANKASELSDQDHGAAGFTDRPVLWNKEKRRQRAKRNELKTLEAEIDDLLHQKEEVERWATVGSA
jgi:phage terminase large subunit-like protein